MSLRTTIASGIRRFADAVGRPSFAGTPYPTGQVAQDSQLGQELGGSGTQNFGGFLKQDDIAEMDSLTAVKNFDIMRRTDAQVNAANQVITQPVRAADVSIDPASQAPDDVKAAAFAEWNLFGPEGVGWDDFLRQALLMLVFGFYLFEKVWAVQETGPWAGYLKIRKLAPRPPKTVWQWFTDEDGRLLSIKQLAIKAGTYQFLDIPAEKLVRFTYNQEGDNFQGISILRSAYPHWLIKQQLYVVDAIRAVRYGSGIPRAKLNAGYSPTKTDRQNLVNLLMGMSSHQHAYIIEPSQVTIDILTPQGGSGTQTAVLPTINHHNEMITKNVLATFIDMGGRSMGGSNALGSSAMDFFMNAINSVANQIADAVNLQILRPLTETNFPPGTGVPTLRFSGIKAKDLKQMAAIVTSLSGAGMKFDDLETENTFRAMMDLPERDDDDVPADGAGPQVPAPKKPGGPPPTRGAPRAPLGGPTPGAAGNPASSRRRPGQAASGAPGVTEAASQAPAATEAAGAAAGGPAASRAPTGGPADYAGSAPAEAADRQPAPAVASRAAQPVAHPASNVAVNRPEQALRPAHEPTAAEAQTTAPVDHTENARTSASGVVPARSNTWDRTVAVPEQPRTTDGMAQAVSHGVPPTAHMARSTTVASSGAADEEGHPSSAAASPSRSPRAGAASPSTHARSTASAGRATTATRTPGTSRAVQASDASRSGAPSLTPTTTPTAPTGTTSPKAAWQKGPKQDRWAKGDPTDPTQFWRPPTPLESRVLDLREMPRRLDTARRGLLGILKSVREEQLLRIAYAVAHRKSGEKIKAPLVGKMVSEVLKVTKPLYDYGRSTVQVELKRQRLEAGPRGK